MYRLWRHSLCLLGGWFKDAALGAGATPLGGASNPRQPRGKNRTNQKLRQKATKLGQQIVLSRIAQCCALQVKALEDGQHIVILGVVRVIGLHRFEKCRQGVAQTLDLARIAHQVAQVPGPVTYRRHSVRELVIPLVQN